MQLNPNELRKLLEGLKSSQYTVDQVYEQIATFGEGELEGVVLDYQRHLRVGFGEVIYGEGKLPQQLAAICADMTKRGVNCLVTRISQEAFEAIRLQCPHAVYNAMARTAVVVNVPVSPTCVDKGYIAIVAAGTSDLPVVEEAYETAKFFGNAVVKVVDVGVAGIHRLFKRLEVIRGARVVIVVAGMEGALASVVGGLVDKPVIAVPTSVGYGASFQGLSALLTMLNSCASGVSVVNIDNGFGAAYCASQINRL